MGLLRFDGFDHYVDSLKVSSGMWGSVDTFGAFSSNTITAGVGRTAAGFRFVAENTNARYSRAFQTIQNVGSSTCYLHFAIKVSRLPNSGTTIGLVGICDTNSVQVMIDVNSDGTIRVLRGHISVLLGTTTKAISSGVWYHFCLVSTIHNTTGMVNLYVNNLQWDIMSGGSPINGLTNQNTRATANNSWNSIMFEGYTNGTIGANTTIDYDDLAVNDSTGSSPYNGFMGDCKVTAVMPTADGNYTQFTPSTGVNHFANVDDNSGTYPNSDTDYNEEATAGERDSHTYTIPSGTILALAPYPFIKQTVAAARSFKNFFRASSTDYDSSTTTNLGTSYLYYPEIYTDDPATGVDWVSGTHEFGVKVQA